MAEKTSSASDLFAETRAFVETYMSQAHFDASHNYDHILRVLALSRHILSVEEVSHPSVNYDATVIELCVLLHDVADHKYVSSSSSPPIHSPNMPSPLPSPLPTSFPSVPPPPGPNRPPAPCTQSSITSTNTTTTPLAFLLSLSCPPPLAHTVQAIITAISYSTETRSPALVHATLRKHPELAIVQDADRLDALGAVGIGRAFTFGGAHPNRGVRGMQGTVEHIQEKLERLEGMMKTDEGRRMAAERTRRVKAFRSWWEEESGGVVVVEKRGSVEEI